MRRSIRSAQVLALVAVCLCVFVPPVCAQECPELIGRLPGSISAYAVSGDYAYIGGGGWPARGSGGELLIADVSDPSTPRVVGRMGFPELDPFNGGRVQAIAVSGDYAYVVVARTCSSEGCASDLRVIDVSTPSAPVQVGSIEGSDATDIVVDGHYVFIVGLSPTVFQGDLSVIDVSTPSLPVQVGYLTFSAPGFWGPLGASVSGSNLYVVDGRDNKWYLLKVDVSSPSQPYVDTFTVVPGAVDVDVSGDYVYVARPDGLHIIDASSLNEVGALNTPGEKRSVVVADDRAYLAGLDGLLVIDVTAPASPAELGSLDGVADTVEVSDGYAFMACCRYECWVGDGGLHVVDISMPSEPTEVGAIETTAAIAVAAANGYAYVGDSGSLRVFDLSAPSAPVEVGSLEIYGVSDQQWSVAASGDDVYVAAGYDGLRVIDVSTRSSPVEVGVFEPGGFASDVAVSAGYVYVADRGDDGLGTTGLRVVDVSTPSAPVEVGFLEWEPGSAGEPIGVAVSGAYAFIAGIDSLRVIDVSNPSSPFEVGFIELSSWDVAVSGSYAYVVGLDGLHVLDVSNPAGPVEVGAVFFDVSSEEWLTIAVSHGYVYVGHHPSDSGDWRPEVDLRVIDVSTPTTPVEAGAFNAGSGYGQLGVAMSEESVLFGVGTAGLFIFNQCTRGPSPNPLACLVPAAAVAAGAEGAFFQTDLELNNTGAEEAQVTLQWLPRGEDNSEPVESEPFTLAPGASLRFENVLTDVFGVEPDSLGAVKLVASTDSVIGMSRTYNIPGGKVAGTFGQGLPAIRETDMIMGTAPQRIIFLSENEDSRANVGCANGTNENLTINVGIFDDEGSLLDTRTMELGPSANDQLNQVLGDWAPINGYVDVWADRDDALYSCYGSMLDNQTSDPTTILPQVPSSDTIHVPAAALAAGAEGSFFTTDLDLNNAGSTDLTYELLWLPRGDDNSDPTRSDTFSLAAGSGVRYGDVLGEVFGLEPDEVGALSIEASGPDLLAMSRTYNTPSGSGAGTFGQELAGIPGDKMIPAGVTKRILFLSENDDGRSNVGCVNGVGVEVAVAVDLYDSDGARLETKYMMLPPYSNRQFNGIFQDHAPINGHVDVQTYTPEASIYCYGSVLDNITSDPTTVLPQ